MSGDKLGVVDFGKLFAETNEDKFSLGGVKCKKICSHPGWLNKIRETRMGFFMD